MSERELIKEYLELKYRYNRLICKINALANRYRPTYKDDFKYSEYKMLLGQLEQQLNAKAKELKEVL